MNPSQPWGHKITLVVYMEGPLEWAEIKADDLVTSAPVANAEVVKFARVSIESATALELLFAAHDAPKDRIAT